MPSSEAPVEKIRVARCHKEVHLSAEGFHLNVIANPSYPWIVHIERIVLTDLLAFFFWNTAAI